MPAFSVFGNFTTFNSISTDKHGHFTLEKQGIHILRKTVAILLLSTFLMNTIGYVGIYALLRWQIVRKISELIEQHDSGLYTKLTLSRGQMRPDRGEFIRINSHEFRYKDKMYDIVSQKQIGDTIHFTVIHDLKDEVNFDHLAANANLQDQTQTNGNAEKPFLFDTMVKNLFNPLFIVTDIRNNSSSSGRDFCAVIPRLNLPDAPYLQVPVPPPKTI